MKSELHYMRYLMSIEKFQKIKYKPIIKCLTTSEVWTNIPYSMHSWNRSTLFIEWRRPIKLKKIHQFQINWDSGKYHNSLTLYFIKNYEIKNEKLTSISRTPVPSSIILALIAKISDHFISIFFFTDLLSRNFPSQSFLCKVTPYNQPFYLFSNFLHIFNQN